MSKNLSDRVQCGLYRLLYLVIKSFICKMNVKTEPYKYRMRDTLFVPQRAQHEKFTFSKQIPIIHLLFKIFYIPFYHVHIIYPLMQVGLSFLHLIHYCAT